jgi:hypothetical protein
MEKEIKQKAYKKIAHKERNKDKTTTQRAGSTPSCWGRQKEVQSENASQLLNSVFLSQGV